MASITYFVALPFARTDDGTLTPEQAVECQNGEQAMNPVLRFNKGCNDVRGA